VSDRSDQAAGTAHRKPERERFVERFEDRFEDPITTVTTITKNTLALFPVRVWRHFLARNGFLLSSGMSYQAIFAIFAAVYVVFAVFGIWLTGQTQTMDALIDLINTYVPGLIGSDGVISREDLIEITQSNSSLFGWTGAVAVVGLVWTAIGWITYSRMAVRSMFGLPKDDRAYVLLKARDFLAALVFGAVLLAAAGLSVASTAAADHLLNLLGIDTAGGWASLVAGAVGLIAVFALDTAALAFMFLFLSGASVTLRMLWGGSLFGGVALVVLQVLGSQLLGGASRNPLLATFAVFIGLLLWFRITSLITLVAAAWIAVTAADRGTSLRRQSPEQREAEQRAAEQRALLIAARVRSRDARAEFESAPWWRRPAASMRLRAAERELAEIVAADARTQVTGDVRG
jgi:membrane protein